MTKNTFVIVTWNNENQIGQLLKSIEEFEPESDVILVDNNSADNTVSVAKRDSKKVSIIEMNDNLGFAKANNIGVEKAKTEYITLINPDTKLTESFVDVFSKKMDVASNIGMIGAKLINSDGSLQSSIFNFQNPVNIIIEQFRLGKLMPEYLKRKYSPELSKHDICQSIDWIMGAFMFTRKDYYSRVGGFSEDYFLYAEDMDICYKYHLINKKILFDPSIIVEHVGGASEKQTNSRKSLKLLESFCIFANKYDYKLNIRTLYECYRLKYILAKVLLFNDKTLLAKYRKNILFLKEKLS